MDHICTTCKQPKPVDEIHDRENEICVDCYEQWFQDECAYWRPLYDGEVLAGIHCPNTTEER